MKSFLDTATLLLLQIILSVTPVLEIALARYYSSAKIRDIGKSLNSERVARFIITSKEMLKFLFA